MQSLWTPAGMASPSEALTDAELEHLYAYPNQLGRPYIRASFVSSLDGAAWIGGVSAGLGSPADRRVFGLLRQLCEVILVGAGTAHIERYAGERRPNQVTGNPPRIAVVTHRAELDPDGPLFTDTQVPPLVLTTPSAPPEHTRLLRATGAEVDTRGTTPALLIAALAQRGLHRVLCEGGPTLFGQMLNANAVDELCLTLTPLLASGPAGRIATSTHATPRRLQLVSVLADQAVLLLRYRLRRSPTAPTCTS